MKRFLVVNVCTICAHGDAAFCQISLTSCYREIHLTVTWYFTVVEMFRAGVLVNRTALYGAKKVY